MNKRTRNWILIVLATAIILAIGYSQRWKEEQAILDGQTAVEPTGQGDD